MKKVRFILKAITIGVVLTAYGLAQNKPESKEKPIIFDVTVQDKYNRIVSGLKAENFEIHDGKEVKDVTSFSYGPEPASIGIIIDLSDSMAGTGFTAVSEPLAEFFAKANPENEYFVLAFSEKTFQLSKLTSDSKAILAGLERVDNARTKGETKLYDSIRSGIEVFDHAKNRKKILIVFTDGQDTGSKTKFDWDSWLVKETRVVVFSMMPVGNPSSFTNFGLYSALKLESLVALSGGSAFYVKPVDIAEYLLRIAIELDNQYSIAFLPGKSKSNKDEWRKIKVKVKTEDEKLGKQLKARTNEGYYAGRKKD